MSMVVALGVLAGGAGAHWARRRWSARSATLRALGEAPRFSVRDFPTGVTGRVTGILRYRDDPLRAPLTGRRCAFYDAALEEVLHERIRETAGADFLLEDETGVALVRARNLQVVTIGDVHYSGGLLNEELPSRVEAFLARHHRGSDGLLLKKRVRYVERILRGGETVSVLAHGIREPDCDSAREPVGYRELPARLVMVASAGHPLYARSG